MTADPELVERRVKLLWIGLMACVVWTVANGAAYALEWFDSEGPPRSTSEEVRDAVIGCATATVAGLMGLVALRLRVWRGKEAFRLAKAAAPRRMRHFKIPSVGFGWALIVVGGVALGAAVVAWSRLPSIVAAQFLAFGMLFLAVHVDEP